MKKRRPCRRSKRRRRICHTLYPPNVRRYMRKPWAWQMKHPPGPRIRRGWLFPRIDAWWMT